MQIWLVRHGATTASRKRLMYGRRDYPLTARGRKQARRLRSKIRPEEFDAIFASPLSRARETAELATGGAEVELDARLLERDFGGFENQFRPLLEWKLWTYGYAETRSYRGEETLAELEARVRDFCEEMCKRYPQGKILVFAHGGIGMIFQAVVLGRPEGGDLYSFPFLGTGKIAVLEYKGA